MHEHSLELMKNFKDTYLDKKQKYSIVDIGSRKVNGKLTYKDIFNYSNWKYTGADIVAGHNVDLILADPYIWNISNNSYNVCISGQCLEHVPDLFRWIKEVYRIVKDGGYVCVIAPWKWEYHRAPVDCWRIMSDGMDYLLGSVAKFKVLEARMVENDCIGIGKKI